MRGAQRGSLELRQRVDWDRTERMTF